MIGDKMQTILITGINGFLGSSLAQALSVEHKIIGLEYSLKNLFRIAGCNYKVYEVNNTIPDEVFHNQRINVIIHTATLYDKGKESYSKVFHNNHILPLNLLDKAIINNCELFINTDTVLNRFISAYALSKRHFQEWLYFRQKDIKVLNIQLEHFYGPGASDDNFIISIIKKLLKNEAYIDLTEGEQKRDFIYINDVVNAYLIILNKINILEGSFHNIEVCTGNLITIKELLLYLKKETNSITKLKFGSIPYRTHELMQSFSENEALRKLGWIPETNLKNGLIKTISYLKTLQNR